MQIATFFRIFHFCTVELQNNAQFTCKCENKVNMKIWNEKNNCFFLTILPVEWLRYYEVRLCKFWHCVHHPVFTLALVFCFSCFKFLYFFITVYAWGAVDTPEWIRAFGSWSWMWWSCKRNYFFTSAHRLAIT